jgi:hypothetical protein
MLTYGFGVVRRWPWISAELSIIDGATMLVLTLMLITSTQFLAKPRSNTGRVELLVMCMCLLLALLLRYIIILASSLYRKGVFGEFGNPQPERIELSRIWLSWLDYSRHLTNTDVVDVVCRMNASDRQTLYKFISSWHALSEDSVPGSNWLLKNLPSRAKVNPEETARVSRTSSRRSSSFGSQESGGTMDNYEDEMEQNLSLPRSLGVLASTGTAMSVGQQKLSSV